MTTATIVPSFTESYFESFVEGRREPEWLLNARRSAWRKFSELNWPARNQEEWIRTDIRMFKLESFRPATDALPLPELPTPLLTQGVEFAGSISACNGRSVAHQLDERWLKRGVLFGPMETLVNEHSDRLRPYFERQVVNPSFDRFAALTSSFWTTGKLLFVPRGVRIELPFHLFAALGGQGVDLSRTLIILDEGAEATVISEMASCEPETNLPSSSASTTSTAALHAGITEVIVGGGARLRFVNFQNSNHSTWHFAHKRAIVERNASLQWTIAALGSRLSKVNQHVALTGRGAESQVNGVMFTEDKQHLSYHTLQHHQAPECRSDFLYKAALQDHSRTVWRGMIKVDPNAQKTDGYQRNDNLLLSSNARADSIPGLEIEADDVRCTHGSTSGNVDEELVFYAQSRGFTRKEAIRLIVTGFFQQVFDRITIENVRDALANAIARRVREYQ